MTTATGIKSIVRAVIIVYYAEHGEKIDEAVRIADTYLSELKEQMVMEASR